LLPAMLLILLCAGSCSTTAPAQKNTWSIKEVGKGLQVGSMAANAGLLAPFIFGTGFLMEQVGSAIEKSDKKPMIMDTGETAMTRHQEE